MPGSSTRRSSKRKNCLLKEKIEIRGVSARCSVSQVYDVMQGLSERKKELVREIGFAGLLSFPPITHMDNKFAVWVMCCVDALEHCIVVDADKKIKFDKHDVGLVFGIPTGGKIVEVKSKRKKEVVSRVWCEMIGIKDSRNRSIKAILDVIQREHGSVMSYGECVSFKLAFVVYVLSTVLAPGSRYDYVFLDFLDALEDPTEIASYDWSEYVFRKVLGGIKQMRNVLTSGKKVPNITGCSLFLQVLYLDSIDLGPWSIEDKGLPRVRFFSGDRFKYMIGADTKDCTKDRKLRTFGIRPLLCPAKVCYSWAAAARDIVIGGCDETKQALWQSIVSLCRLHDMPDEEGGRLFHIVSSIDLEVGSRITAAVAAFVDNYGRQRFRDGDCHYLNAPDNDKMIGVLPCYEHVGQCSYGGSSNMCAEDRSAELLLDNSYAVCKSSSHGNGYSCNLKGVDESTCYTASCVIKDPWDLGFNFKYTMQGAVEMLSDMCSAYANGKQDFMIGIRPKVVALKISDLLCKMFGSVELDVQFVDALIGCIKYRDATLYGGLRCVRWRHFVHCNFMESLLARNFDKGGVVATSNFAKEYVGYDVSSCKMVFFPSRLPDRWVCYAWRPYVQKMVVFDPLSFMGDGNVIFQFHEDMFELLMDALTQVQGLLCSPWVVGGIKPSLEIVNAADGFVRKNRSGLACLYFCCMFDGLCVRGGDSMADVGLEAPVIIAEAVDAMKPWMHLQ
ncbi:unnamed protein product [Urochloa decumbens]|uniref:Uncharacterized protein n=1 Tax=Urochloa decumbens TaxID=240449 RepID=A0ABC8VZT6_9POAL